MGNTVVHDFHHCICVVSGHQRLFDEEICDFGKQAHFAAEICHSHGHGVLVIIVFGFKKFSGESIEIACRCEAGSFGFQGICVRPFDYGAEVE